MEMRLEVAVKNKNPLESMRLISGCFAARNCIAISQFVIDKIVVAYLESCKKIKEEAKNNHELTVLMMSNIRDMINCGCSNEVIEELNEFYSEINLICNV